jgi:D-3-phosphoglycerate dehydrogenase
MNSTEKRSGLLVMETWEKLLPKNFAVLMLDVLCYDILDNVGDENAGQVSLEELQKRADVLSLHLPWTPETDKMINAAFINAFAKPFWIINTSRGKNIVTADLVEAMKV